MIRGKGKLSKLLPYMQMRDGAVAAARREGLFGLRVGCVLAAATGCHRATRNYTLSRQHSRRHGTESLRDVVRGSRQ